MSLQSQSPESPPSDNPRVSRPSERRKTVNFKDDVELVQDDQPEGAAQLSAPALEKDAKPGSEDEEVPETEQDAEEAGESQVVRRLTPQLIQRSNSFHETTGKSANQVIEELELDSSEDDLDLDASFSEAETNNSSHTRARLSYAEARMQAFMRGVSIPVEARTAEDVDAIFDALKTIQDPFFARLEVPVKRAICERLKYQVVNTGELIFDYGDFGDRLFLIWTGRVQSEVPRDKPEQGKPAGALVKRPALDPGQVFGELAVVSDDNTRKARCTALKRTELLCLDKAHYAECIGVSQTNFVREGVAFLRAVDGGVLEDCADTDLQAMTKCFVEEHHIGSTPIVCQGAEVDRIIFVKSGFCALTRQLHPKFKHAFDQYSDYREPLPNPFDNDSGGLLVGQKSVFPMHQKARSKTREGNASSKKTLGADIGLASRERLQKLLKQHQQAVDETSQLLKQKTGLNDASLAESAASDSCDSEVVVETLSRGGTVGVMELMENMTYQHSVVPAPWAEVYIITKLDFIREVSKTIIQRMFCEYKARLGDKQLVQRLKQKSRWDHYKTELVEAIRNRNSAMSRGIIDRDDPPARSVGVSGLPMGDVTRIGNGMKIWDKRAQTPPKQGYQMGEQVQQIFHVHCIVDDNGRKDVVLGREQRDASMDALEERLVLTLASTRQKAAIRKSIVAGAVVEGGAVDSSSSPLGQAIQKPSPEHVQRQGGEVHGQALAGTATSKVSRPRQSPRSPAVGYTPRSAAGVHDSDKVISLPPLTPRSASRLHQARSTSIALKVCKSSKQRVAS